MTRPGFLPVLLLSVLLCGACSFSPTFTRPEMDMPQTFKQEDGWKTATPLDAAERGPWWRVFRDPVLDGLMERLNAHNQNLAQAAANLRQARAQAASARAAFLPSVGAQGSATRGNAGAGQGTRATYSGGISASWEISFWNVLPAYEATREAVRATAADYATMRLAMQAELAQTYFQLRTLDAQHELYQNTIAAYARAVQLTRSQYQGGVVTPSDVAQAEAQLAGAEASLADLDRQRAILENTLSVLLGEIPSAFTLERSTPLAATLPGIPQAVPSSLLERRPDVAGAERRAASANEQIGIARAAWFPTLTLGADRILQGDWLQAPIRSWSLGPSAAMSLFEGGKRLAETDAAWAAYDAAAAAYRQTVLEAFKDVEDNLASLSYYAKQAEAQDRAVTASQTALRLALSQYRGGMTTYLQVVSSQTTLLTNERQALQVQGQRLIASVNLIKAMGGGWTTADLKDLAFGQGPAEGAAQEPER